MGGRGRVNIIGARQFGNGVCQQQSLMSKAHREERIRNITHSPGDFCNEGYIRTYVRTLS